MLADNLCRAGLRSGCWLLEISIPEGAELARAIPSIRSWASRAASLCSAPRGWCAPTATRPTSRPSASAWRAMPAKAAAAWSSAPAAAPAREPGSACRICRKALSSASGISSPKVWNRPAVSRCGEIVVACMAASSASTPPVSAIPMQPKNQQDMALLRAEVRRCLPEATALHEALAHSVSVREALLSLPDATRTALLHRLAHLALEQFARHCPGSPALRLLVFDFDGSFLMEQSAPGRTGRRRGHARCAPGDDARTERPSDGRAGRAAGRSAGKRGGRTTSSGRRTSATVRWTSFPAASAFPGDEATQRLLTQADAVYASRPCWRPAPCP